MSIIKSAVRAVIPIGLIELRHAWRKYRTIKQQPFEQPNVRSEFHDARHQRIELISRTTQRAELKATSYDQVVGFLVQQGVSEHHVRQGSIPAQSLEFISNNVLSTFESNAPVSVLHVGNFVGVSLAYIAEKVANISPKSLVVAIDPNIPHRGVKNPQEIVTKLLCGCRLQRNVLLITGYSIEKNISNDGTIIGDYDPVSFFQSETSCENVLLNLVNCSKTNST